MNSFSLLHGVVSKICTVHVADFFYDFAHAEDCFWFVKTNALESKGITEHKRKLSLYSLFSRPFIYVNPLTVRMTSISSLPTVSPLNRTSRSRE